MLDFVELASKQLGIDAGTATSATSGVLNLLKGQDSGSAGDNLLAAIPGAQDFLSSNSGGGGGGGALGGLMGGLGSMMGGSGGAVGALASLAAGGLDTNKIGPFVSMFVDYAKQKAGPELVEKFLKAMPSIGQMLTK
jgi:hypothetical protein